MSHESNTNRRGVSKERSVSFGKREAKRQKDFGDAISRLAADRYPFYPTLGNLLNRDFQAWPLQEYITPEHAISNE